MILCQLEKLKQTSRELNHNMYKMHQKGRSDAVVKLNHEKLNIDACIQQVEEDKANLKNLINFK